MKNGDNELTALDFFAGSGLVTKGLEPAFATVWANDISAKKARVYTENFGDETFQLGPIESVDGRQLPGADMAWASFPCQDLSLAGKMNGLGPETRSGLFWQWLRVLDEMPASKQPLVLCLENVLGFLVAEEGKQFKLAYDSLRAREYVLGALVLDARHFTPQSRARAFAVAVHSSVPFQEFASSSPLRQIHPKATRTAYSAVRSSSWVWWKLPRLPRRIISFTDICDREAPCDPAQKTKKLLSMLSALNRQKLEEAVQEGNYIAGTGYRRIRKDENGEKAQRLEIRFDGLAGCLRVPSGGSSRQIVVIVDNGEIKTRLLTVREAAKLMGLEAEYWLPDSYNEAYWALGDAVAVPVTRFLATRLLAPLCKLARGMRPDPDTAALQRNK